MPANPTRNSLYKVIETGCNALGLDDELKRDMFFSVTGVRSKTLMDQFQLMRVLGHLRERGFEELAHSKKPVRTQQDYMALLWAKLAKAGKVKQNSVQALDAWVGTQTAAANGGVGVSSHKMLSTWQARAMIERLKEWLAR